MRCPWQQKHIVLFLQRACYSVLPKYWYRPNGICGRAATMLFAAGCRMCLGIHTVYSCTVMAFLWKRFCWSFPSLAADSVSFYVTQQTRGYLSNIPTGVLVPRTLAGRIPKFGRATYLFWRRDETLHLHADSHPDANRLSLTLNVYRNALNTHHQTSIWNMHGVSRGLMDGAIPPAAHDFAARMPSKTGIRPPPTFLTVYGEHVKL